MGYTTLSFNIFVLYVISSTAAYSNTGPAVAAAAAAAAAAKPAAGAGTPATTCNPLNCICHGELGCFHKRTQCMENSAPLPESPAKIGTKFLLFKRGSRQGTPLTNKMTGSQLFAAGFDARRKTVIPIHGWTQSSAAFDGLRTVLLKKGDFNVILVDWEKGAGITQRWPLAYTQPVQNTRVVGKQIALLISHLQSTTNVNLNQVHLIGASLGAQVAGYTGMYLNGTLGRISGLDPSKPNFEGQPAECKLEATDAQFVDIVHTNMDVAGIAESVGHVDFFPNGGRSQPGCTSAICSHLRAKSYYRSSVWTDCQFHTTRCDGAPCGPQGCPPMGFNAFRPSHITATKKGEYCLTTIERPPYCTDQKNTVPNYPGKTDPIGPNTGNAINPSGPNPPRVSTNNADTSWFNSGKPMSKPSSPARGPAAGANAGNTQAHAGSANRLQGQTNSGVRIHSTFAIALSALLTALFAAML